MKGTGKISLTYYPIEIFNSTVVLCYSSTLTVDEIATELCNRFNIKNDEDTYGDTGYNSALTLDVSHSRTVYLIFDRGSDLGILNHEISHATKAIMSYIQTPINTDTEEVYAYLSQYLFTNCYNKLKTFKSCKHCTEVFYKGVY